MTFRSTPIKHICIVEDNDFFRETLVVQLKSKGFRVSGFMNGLEALAVLDQTEFDLVVSDIEMPEMTGLELLKCIQDRNCSLPVILMTGGHQRLKAMLDLGAAALLKKPFGMDDLLPLISETLATADAKRIT